MTDHEGDNRSPVGHEARAPAPEPGRLKQRLITWARTSGTSVAYRLLTAAFISLLLSTALWLLLLTLISVGQDKSGSWNSIGQLVGGTAATAAAAWLVRTLPPLQSADDLAAKQRFLVMCLSGVFLFLSVEYWLWHRGSLPATVAPAELSTQIDALRKQVEDYKKSVDSAAAYLDAYSDTWQQIPAGTRRWRRIPVLRDRRYRIDVKPEKAPAGTLFEVVVVDDEGKLIAGRRANALQGVRFYGETGSGTRSLAIGIRWIGSAEGTGTRQPSQLTANVTVLRTETDQMPVPRSDRAQALIPSELPSRRASDFGGTGRLQGGSCGGAKQPDHVFRLELKEPGWVRLGLQSGLPGALYLLSDREIKDGDDVKRVSRELACDDSEADPQPQRKLGWRSQFEVALNAGVYVVVAAGKEGASNAELEFSTKPFDSTPVVMSLDAESKEVSLDFLGLPVRESCEGKREVFRDLKLSGSGPFSATVQRSAGAAPYGFAPLNATVPFASDASATTAWYRETQQSKRCVPSFVGAQTDSTLRVRLDSEVPPPVVTVRLQRALSPEQWASQALAACEKAASLTPGASETISLEKDDAFAANVTTSDDGSTSATLTFAAMGAGAVDAVRKIKVTQPSELKLTISRPKDEKVSFVAYLLPNCTPGAPALFADRSSAFRGVDLGGKLAVGEYFLVVDGTEPGERGSFSAKLSLQ